MTNCSIDGCSTATQARGLCSKHYKRFLRHGDPLQERVSWERGKRRSPETVKIGDRFGYWTVTGLFVRQEDGQARFPCVCDCGTTREVLWRGMREFGSCGCRQKEVMATKRKHGVGPTDPGYDRARYLWAQYQMTPQDVQDLLVAQDFQCAICLDSIDENTCRVDHNHQTTQRRGLLCHHCNVGIGHLREDVEILSRAITYLTANVPD